VHELEALDWKTGSSFVCQEEGVVFVVLKLTLE